MDCKNCDEKQACVPFFVHENALMHYNRSNKRMLLCLVAALVFAVIVIAIFVHGNTVREKQIIDMTQQWITEVTDGVHQQSNP